MFARKGLESEAQDTPLLQSSPASRRSCVRHGPLFDVDSEWPSLAQFQVAVLKSWLVI